MIVSIGCYLRGYLGFHTKVRRLPQVRRTAAPRMTKVVATRAPEGFGLSTDEIEQFNATATMHDTGDAEVQEDVKL